MLSLVWTEEAEADRVEIAAYVSQFDRAAAIRMDGRFAEAAEKLRSFPNLGRQGLVSGTRELIPHPNYRLVYEIVGDEVWILTLVHVARAWPPVDPD